MGETTLESINFIETDLIPEMVHNRCFCESGSREFVEFESVSVRPLITSRVNKTRELYRGKVIIRFSGEPKSFDIIIKLLPTSCQDDDRAYGSFLNEEMFYNKMTAKFKLNIYPKCYAADMGRYGRPVVVLEDLEAVGYRHLSTKLDGNHLKLLLQAIAEFHACGIDLKHKEFSIFREFYAKLIETKSDGDKYMEKFYRALHILKENESEYVERLRRELGSREMRCEANENPFFTICHGNLDLNHSLFFYDGERPISVQILGWNRMVYTSPTIDLESILRETQLEKNCITEIHKNFDDYFDTLFSSSTTLKNEGLRMFFRAIFVFLVFSTIPESPENEHELINFLNSLL
ncbi:uncharacterized LOC105268972 [Fopius arisanus]|nr:uncharacterized LOC105268972 [Fopius arisanus]KAG8362544.1 EcKinase 15 [Fopius arisanus]